MNSYGNSEGIFVFYAIVVLFIQKIVYFKGCCQVA